LAKICSSEECDMKFIKFLVEIDTNNFFDKNLAIERAIVEGRYDVAEFLLCHFVVPIKIEL
jgi:hypothetical protein